MDQEKDREENALGVLIIVTDLKEAVASIQRSKAARGITVTEEEMAEKMGIPVTQLQDYLNDKTLTPEGFPAELMAAFKIRRTRFQVELQRKPRKLSKDPRE